MGSLRSGTKPTSGHSFSAHDQGFCGTRLATRAGLGAVGYFDSDSFNGDFVLTIPCLSARLDELRQLNVTIRQQLDVAELMVPTANELVAQLASIGLATEAALLGEIIYDQAYAPVPNYTEGSQLLQAAILVTGGLGLVLWDRDEYLSFRDNQGPGYHEARLRFVVFDELGSALKAMLLPQVEPLLGLLPDTRGVRGKQRTITQEEWDQFGSETFVKGATITQLRRDKPAK